VSDTVPVAPTVPVRWYESWPGSTGTPGPTGMPRLAEYAQAVTLVAEWSRGGQPALPTGAQRDRLDWSP
jgi:hypothetical protein